MDSMRFFAASVFLVGSSALGAPAKPNIVLILADDLGWRDLSVMGSTFYKTPNIDQIAKDGLLFTDAYAAYPLCSPTRAGLLTGMDPQRTGFTAPAGHADAEVFTYTAVKTAQPWARAGNATSATRLDTRFTTYPELLKKDGYVTAHFGKWHLGFSPYMPKDHGFDVDIPGWNVPGPGRGYMYPWDIPDLPSFPGKSGEQLEERLGQEAGRFIRENKDRPFLMNYWAFSVHAPYNGRPDLIKKYEEQVDRNNPQQSPTMAAMIESLDNAVGHIRKVLAEEGLTENTIIIFTSDNGGSAFGVADGVLPTSNAPLKSGKGNIYEGGTRVPLIVSWPGVTKPGSVTSALAQTTDLMATILEFAEVKLPEDYCGDGVSLVPVLKGKESSVRDAVYCYFPQNVEATGNLSGAYVRRGNYKLIRFFSDNTDFSDRFELYDLSSDIGETNNLAACKPELVGELSKDLARHLKETESSIPGKNQLFDPAAARPYPVYELHGGMLVPLEIKNPGFEEPVLQGDQPVLDPSLPGYAEQRKLMGWDFGFFAGICREQSAYADQIPAAEGHQAAFLSGDQELTQHKSKAKCVFGTDIIGLIPHQTYRLSWQQTGKASDAGSGALTVMLSAKGSRPVFLQQYEKVTEKGRWETKTHSFTATQPVMRLNFRHSIPETANPIPYSETTLIDNVTIVKEDKPKQEENR